MSVTRDTPFHCGTQITEDQWVAEIRRIGALEPSNPLWHGYATPEEGARDCYREIISWPGESAEVWIGMAVKEHSFGLNPASILHRNDTRSWGNTRTCRVTAWKQVQWRKQTDAAGAPIYEILPVREGEYQLTTHPSRSGTYVRYPKARAGLRDAIWRIRDPAFTYQLARVVTILDVIRVYAPDTDGNRPEQYADTVAGITTAIRKLYGEQPMVAQIPGFTWVPADGRHHTKGRGGKRVQGGAQHYTGGSNSLGWLTTSPNSDVSAHVLIKHNPTMADRGWQLVDLRDTAHTTGGIVNPITVAIEYEQLDGQMIPDIAYEVMAQTWLDIIAKCEELGIGTIKLMRNEFGIRGHKEWVGDNRVCPDGIVVDRIVNRAIELRLGSTPVVEETWMLPGQNEFAGGVYKGLGFQRGFKGTMQSIGAAKYAADPAMGALTITGYVLEKEWRGVDGCSYQRCERVTLQWNPQELGNAPWETVFLLPTTTLPERAPE